MRAAQERSNRITFGVSPSRVVALVAVSGGWRFTLKRATDRAVALLALLFLAPLLLAIAVGVRVSSAGPVIRTTGSCSAPGHDDNQRDGL
jgi:lipopolysaccharide/colanic/teichoic acid biosynthesis glycosyltransferase